MGLLECPCAERERPTVLPMAAAGSALALARPEGYAGALVRIR